jgi:hypothetical protein
MTAYPLISKDVRNEVEKKDLQSPQREIKPDPKAATVRVSAKSPNMQDTARKEILSNERLVKHKEK